MVASRQPDDADADEPGPDLGTGPNRAVLDRAVRALRPVVLALDPELLGLDRIPAESGNLYIGNHTMIGMLDYAVLMVELYRRKGITFWSLGDHFHFSVPLWRELLRANGAFDGTHENCTRVLHRGGNIVIFPGGAQEVTRRSGEQYELLWGDRTGFARLAIRAQAPVVPFANVGGDDWYRIVYDTNQLLGTPVGDAIDAGFRRRGMHLDGYLPSVIRGVGPTLLPRAERLYYWFGEPVDPTPYAGREHDDGAVREYRDQVRDAVAGGIKELLAYREQDPKRTPARRLRALGDAARSRVRRVLPG